MRFTVFVVWLDPKRLWLLSFFSTFLSLILVYRDFLLQCGNFINVYTINRQPHRYNDINKVRKNILDIVAVEIKFEVELDLCTVDLTQILSVTTVSCLRCSRPC